jgi:hypothetical protein
MMRVEHVFQLKAHCPVDERIDEYTVTVVIDRLVKIEDILGFAQALGSRPIFQEDLTRLLAEKLDGKVMTVGMHSGVRTTCTIEPSGSGA